MLDVGAINFKRASTASSLLGAFIHSRQANDFADHESFLADHRKKMASIRADQILSNAREVQARGTRESQDIARDGRVMESDMAAQVAASGLDMDPSMLAKLRANTEYNALAAMFDAEGEASSMRQHAISTRYGGVMDAAGMKLSANQRRTGAQNSLYRTGSSLLWDWARTNRRGGGGYRTVGNPHQ